MIIVQCTPQPSVNHLNLVLSEAPEDESLLEPLRRPRGKKWIRFENAPRNPEALSPETLKPKTRTAGFRVQGVTELNQPQGSGFTGTSGSRVASFLS